MSQLVNPITDIGAGMFKKAADAFTFLWGVVVALGAGVMLLFGLLISGVYPTNKLRTNERLGEPAYEITFDKNTGVPDTTFVYKIPE